MSGILLGFLSGFFYAQSMGPKGPLAYLAALKVILWDYSNVTMALQFCSDIPVYTSVGALTAWMGSTAVRAAFPQMQIRSRFVKRRAANAVLDR